MVSKLFIEWDLQELRLVCGSVSGGRLSGEGCESVLAAPDDYQSLKIAIDKLRFTGDTADIVLPRELVSFRRLQLPTVSDEELPAMVRLQAATKLSTSVSNLVLDFIPMPYASDAPMREVMLVSIPAARLKQLTSMLSDCGLKLGMVRAAPYVIANAAAVDGSISKARNTQSMIVWVSGAHVDIVIVQNRVVEFAHSSILASSGDAEVLARSVKAEYSRAQLTAGEQIEQFSPVRVAVYASDAVLPGIVAQLRKSSGDVEVTSHSLDSKLLAELKSSAADVSVLSIPAAGLISADVAEVLDVDFCSPRKAIVKPDTRRQRVLLGALVSVCIFAAAWYWREGKIERIESDKSFVSSQLGEIRKTLRENSDVFKQANAVDDWVNRDINWLEEIRRLHEIMPGTDRVYIRDVRLQSTRGGDDVGTIVAEGFAKTLLDRDALGRTLREAGYGVESLASSNNARLIDQDYPIPLTFTLSLPEDRQWQHGAANAPTEDSESGDVAAR